jgi:hypothetical protein
MVAAFALAALGASAALQALPALAAEPVSPVDSSAIAARGEARRSTNRIDLALGTLHMALRDDIVCPLKWAGPGGTLEAGYWRRSLGSRSGVELGLPLGLLNNRYGHRAGALGLRAGYTYLRHLADPRGRGSVFLGGCLRRDSDLQLYADWDEEHLYWITTYDLGVAARHEVELRNGHDLEFQAVLPVVSLISRPPRRRFYKIDDFKNPGFYLTKPQESLRFTALGELVSFDASVSYAFAMAGSWAFRAQYGFSYRRYTRPETIVERTSTFTLRATHDF